MSTRQQLVRLLADGRFHSGAFLGQNLGVSRTAVWKHIQELSVLGLDIFAVRGKGYRLAYPLELLDKDLIRTHLGEETATSLGELEILDKVGSTNDYLGSKLRTVDTVFPAVCLAEMQTKGRGRRGRTWVSPYGTNLYLSLSWVFQPSGAGIEGLSLAVAVSIARILSARGVNGVCLKWPNDILLGDRKLSGILIDLVGETSGDMRVVVGVGINCNVSPSAAEGIDQPWADLSSAGVNISRNTLAAEIISALLECLIVFSREGLDSFMDDWHRFDHLDSRSVRLNQGNRTIYGIARGIDDNGALLLEYNGRIQKVHAGEVSVRQS